MAIDIGGAALPGERLGARCAGRRRRRWGRWRCCTRLATRT